MVPLPEIETIYEIHYMCLIDLKLTSKLLLILLMEESFPDPHLHKHIFNIYILYVMLRIAYQRIAPHRFAQVNLCERACAFSVDLKVHGSGDQLQNQKKCIEVHAFSWFCKLAGRGRLAPES